MSRHIDCDSKGRRLFLARSAAATATLSLGAATLGDARAGTISDAAAARTEPFWGAHQGGILTRIQRHTYFIAFDLVTDQRNDVIKLLRAWTQAAAEMTAGSARIAAGADKDQPGAESGAATGIPPSRLTVTFGFGPTLFDKDGKDRYGLAAKRPEALVDMPKFPGDQLIPERTGGDLSVQASADDPMVVETAARHFAKLASGIAVMRWAQMGFTGGYAAGETGRNQMGFKDGTMNPKTSAEMNQFVWVGKEGPAWLQGGSYMVIRPIRIALEHWDEMKIAFQERSVGREKTNGAPLGKKHENDPLDLAREDKEGNSVIPEESHVALSAPENNGGAQILRHAFNYDNGIAKIAERWPPWRQIVTFDAGLLFQCYQKDPRTGFIRLFAKMAVVDMLNQFTTHTGSALFACPPGAKPGEFIGQDLFA
ncbi:MAG: Dyp-type peroxidase [Rudaea sp.]|uniref:Dyp-type peroxidase n=1 Tax=unclassified Rudaea TaxID=2627037 RepID=UPI001AD2DD16|nr:MULTISPECIES: Dyp-type peroxidase [unclassified Rudaea]MBN8886213.1 Dyp-type peroxidase [Rudaea sp.]MBR0345567.1 Dyp-type peroxidase [Rudaea sp.]